MLKLLQNLGLRKDKASSNETVAQNLGLRKAKPVSSNAVTDSDVPVLSKGIIKRAKTQKNDNLPFTQKTNKIAARKKTDTCETVQKGVKHAMRTRTASKFLRTGRKWSQTSKVENVGKKARSSSRMLSTMTEIRKRSKMLAKKQPKPENDLISNPRTQKVNMPVAK